MVTVVICWSDSEHAKKWTVVSGDEDKAKCRTSSLRSIRVAISMNLFIKSHIV